MISSNMFDMGSGPDLKGTWKNFRTGEVITIRDTIFEDNQLVGITNNGGTVPYNRLQNFIKCDPNEITESKKSTQQPKAEVKPFVDDINDIYKDDDKFEKPVTTTISNNTGAGMSREDPIRKVLDGLSPKDEPKIDVDLKWGEIPEGIVFLKKYLGTSTDAIIEACIGKYVNMDRIKESLEKKLRKCIESGLEVPKETKKTENKKTKS